MSLSRLCCCLVAVGVGIVSVAVPLAGRAQNPPPAGDAVILLTLDGARTEEMFGGLDLEVLTSTLEPDQRVEDSPVYTQFWADAPDARRRTLMPFFWSLVTEQVFNLNGIGKLFVQAVTRSDFTMVQSLVLLVAVFFIVVNFIIDLLYAWLDPRIRYR